MIITYDGYRTYEQYETEVNAWSTITPIANCDCCRSFLHFWKDSDDEDKKEEGEERNLMKMDMNKKETKHMMM